MDALPPASIRSTICSAR